MVGIAARRALNIIPLALLVSVLSFLLLLLVPGDPATTLAGENPAPGQVEAIREQLGLDRPLVLQYLSWLGSALQGDFGTSIFSRAEVGELVWARVPVSLSLAVVTLVMAIVVGLTAGLVAAAYRGSVVDRVVTMIASAGIAAPSFWIGLLLVTFIALQLQLLPAVGYVPLAEDPVEWLKHLLLPAAALAAHPAAEIARQLRGSLCDVLDNDYIRTARAKGLRRRPILLKHALKNSGTVVVTVIGLELASLLGGAIVVEQIFAIPGLGSLTVMAVLQRDVPVIQAVVLLSAVAVLVTTYLVDLSYGYFNPKVRVS